MLYLEFGAPQRDGADGYSYLIPSHFSVYFFGNCELQNDKPAVFERGVGEKEEEGLEASILLLLLLLMITIVTLALGNAFPFSLQDKYDTAFGKTKGSNKMHMTHP